MSQRDSELGEVIVEFVRNGAYLKCSAIHVATGREVSAVGPANDPRSVERVAVAKLKRALMPDNSANNGSAPRRFTTI